MNKTNRQAGFVLIEVVSTLILIGIIGAFTGFFLYYGITGFLASKRNSEGALKVQVAMDRIGAELRDIKASPKPIFEAKKVTYQSNTLTLPPGDRVLQIENVSNVPGIYLTVGGTKNILLDNVDLAKSDITYSATRNLDNSANGSNEISFIKVTFSLNDLGKPFEVKIYPRAMITFP